MNDLQRRLVTILQNIDAPVTAEAIRIRCQMPQAEGLIACNLRGLEREGKILQWRRDVFVHKDFNHRADPRPAVTIKPPPKDKPVKKNASVPPKAMPNEAPERDEAINEELALLSERSQMEEAAAPHKVDDAALKITVLRHLQDLATPRVSAMLERVIDEDLVPFAGDLGQA